MLPKALAVASADGSVYVRPSMALMVAVFVGSVRYSMLYDAHGPMRCS